MDGATPSSNQDLIRDLLQYNDNSSNPVFEASSLISSVLIAFSLLQYSDSFYLAELLESLGNIRERDSGRDGAGANYVSADLARPLFRYLDLDRVLPSFRGIVTQSCLLVP